MKYEPLSGREFPRYSGIKTFFRLPHVSLNADYDVALVGVPYDGGVSYRPGARFAPTHVRQASSLGRGYHWSRAEHLWEKRKFADIGDCPTVPIHQEQTYARIENFFTSILKSKNKKFIAVGGDHSITLPILRSVSKKYGVLSLIHFDAHLDTYPAAWDCEYHHGTFLRHAVEENLVDPKNVLQIGLRGPLVGKDDLAFVKKYGMRSTTIDDIRKNGLESFIKTLPKFTGPTYITFDIDSLDPAFAPGTGTPVVGGLTTYEAQIILRSLQIKNLVGADVVEISPSYDHADITALAAVAVMFELMFFC
ncbi:MAG: agmatinase [Bdellovibrionales bacterium RBG_16_40_8]|nr:MAG: agmatinase [Bdellovibrionales bacterium RBG_16_40_8]